MHISPSATINLLLLSRSPPSRYAYYSNTHATASRVDLSVRQFPENWSGLPFDEAHSDYRYQGSTAVKRTARGQLLINAVTSGTVFHVPQAVKA